MFVQVMALVALHAGFDLEGSQLPRAPLHFATLSLPRLGVESKLGDRNLAEGRAVSNPAFRDQALGRTKLALSYARHAEGGGGRIVRAKRRPSGSLRIVPSNLYGARAVIPEDECPAPREAKKSGWSCAVIGDHNYNLNTFREPLNVRFLGIDVGSQVVPHHLVRMIEGQFGGSGGTRSGYRGPAGKGQAAQDGQSASNAKPEVSAGDPVGAAFLAKAGVFAGLGLLAGGAIGAGLIGGEIRRWRWRWRLALVGCGLLSFALCAWLASG